MKVYLGPYPSRAISKIHTNYMDKKYDYDWDDSNNKFEKFLEKLEDLVQVFYNYTINIILDRRKKKEVIRLHDYDTWSVDATLSPIILALLKQFRGHLYGAPDVSDEDVPDELKGGVGTREKYNQSGETDAFWHKRWEWVLDEMIWTFEALSDDDFDDQFHSGEIDMKFEKMEGKPFYEMKKGPNDTHEFDKEGYVAASKRIDNGLRLFGKYYRGLWD